MKFEDYWENYGELHASMCGGNIKQFAKEIWLSAESSSEKMLERLKAETVKELSALQAAWDTGRDGHGQDGYDNGYDDAIYNCTEDIADLILKYEKEGAPG